MRLATVSASTTKPVRIGPLQIATTANGETWYWRWVGYDRASATPRKRPRRITKKLRQRGWLLRYG